MISSEKASNNLNTAIAHLQLFSSHFFFITVLYLLIITGIVLLGALYLMIVLNIILVLVLVKIVPHKYTNILSLTPPPPPLFLFWGKHCISMSNKDRQLWNTILNVVYTCRGSNHFLWSVILSDQLLVLPSTLCLIGLILIVCSPIVCSHSILEAVTEVLLPHQSPLQQIVVVLLMSENKRTESSELAVHF